MASLTVCYDFAISAVITVT